MKRTFDPESILRNFKTAIVSIKGKLYTRWRETHQVEFKKSLHTSGQTIGKDYLRTISGLANNQGGFIVFGVADDYEIVGIKGKYEDLDNVYFSNTIQEGLDGSFNYTFFTTRVTDKLIGLLYVSQAFSRPVILKYSFNDNGNLVKMGDIYFRYPAQTKRILATDLRLIVDEEIKKGVQAFQDKINKLIQIGPESSAILDKVTGEITTDKDTSVKLILEKSILDQLNIIDEGRLVEKDGAPAYIIKGEIHPESDIQVVEKTIKSGIRGNDIYNAFFSESCSSPQDYIKEIIFKTSHYYPIYFFANKAGMSREDLVDFIQDIAEPDIKKATKSALLRRVKNNDKIRPVIPLAKRFGKNS